MISLASPDLPGKFKFSSLSLTFQLHATSTPRASAVIMDPHKAGSESKSLRKRGKQILGASFNTIGALLGNKSRKALEAPEKPSWYDDSWGSGGAGRFSMAGSSFEDLAEPYREDGPPISGGSGSSAVSGFLTKSPDPSWIDIEMIGYWLKKCDTEHGEQCRRPFGLDPLGLGQAQWLIDVRRKCLAPAKPENRYACLSYVCK